MELENNEAQSPAVEENAVTAAAKLAAAASAPAPENREVPRWYILHTYSGFEQRVEQTIREMMRNRQENGLIKDVIVPTERVIEPGKNGQKRTTTRKFYPGYIMINMIMTDFSWHMVQSILSLMETRQEQPRPKFSFEVGDEVRVEDGPFAGFNGVVEDVNDDKGKIKVLVSIFGRQTPLELSFMQVS